MTVYVSDSDIGVVADLIVDLISRRFNVPLGSQELEDLYWEVFEKIEEGLGIED